VDLKKYKCKKISSGGNNVIHYFAKNPKSTIEIFKMLINVGADGLKINSKGRNVLMYYVKHTEDFSIECLKFLINAGSKINQVDRFGNPVSFFAVSSESLQLATLQ